MRLHRLILICTLLLWTLPASADEAVSIGTSTASLIRPKSARGSIILMPGSNGDIQVDRSGEIHRMLGNQLVRTRYAYASRGLAVLVVGADVDLAAAVAYMAGIKRPVTVVATSRGTQRAARGIAAGARPDALVLASGFLADASGSRENVMNILGSPASLPRTLVLHHRQDGCRFTGPAGVDPFIAWAGGRARVKWLDGGLNEGDPCEPGGPHGFAGLDGQVVSQVAAFR